MSNIIDNNFAYDCLSVKDLAATPQHVDSYERDIELLTMANKSYEINW